MKNTVLILIMISGIIASCEDFLDKKPLDEISDASFWKTEDDLKLATNNLYTGIDRSITLDSWSIDYFSDGPNPVSSGTNTIPNGDSDWSSSYTFIRRANDILENIEKADLDQSIKNRYKGEARFFRAYYYFRLIKRFGDVPLISSTLDFNSEEVYGVRNDRLDVADQIIADLQWAADHLSNRSELSPEDKGRITKGVALGFLSRVTLYEGTRAKYHGYGEYNELLEIARDAALEVINSGEYELFPDFLGIFREENENNFEVMLAYFYEEGITERSPRGRPLIIDASLEPTKYLADAFLAEDGLPIEYSALFEGYSSHDSEFINRDPRMEATIWRPGTPFENNEPLVPDLTRTFTGYSPKKPGDPQALNATFIYTDDILMRYAEVLLNYAEATYESQGSISDADLDISINKLRDRVGMPHLTNAFVNGQNPANVPLDMKEEIRRERRVELAGEGFRYDDLVRWKIAEDELPKPIIGAKFYPEAYPDIVAGEDIRLNENGFILVQSAASRQFDENRNYLFPIPLREISLNNNLAQNPGWN